MRSVLRVLRGRGVVLLAAFVLFAAVRVPASVLVPLLPPELTLANVQGSLWQGQASAVGVGGMVVQEWLRWRFEPDKLISGQLAWSIDGGFGDKVSHLTLLLSPIGIALDSIQLVLPLEPLASMSPMLKPAQLGAELQINARSLNVRTPMTALIIVEHLSSPLIPHEALGDYRIELNGDATGKGRWNIATVSGSLHATGQGTFDAAGKKFNGTIRFTPQSALPGLTAALSQLPRSGEGHALSF